MSYSIFGNYRTKATAIKQVKARTDLPEAVKTLIVDSVETFPADTDDSFIKVQGSGHTSHNIQVERHGFAT